MAVNAEYEIAGVTARLDRKQAVIFDKVRGTNTRVLSNAIATPTEGFTLPLEVRLIKRMNQISRRIFTLALVKLFIAYQSLYVLRVVGY